MGESVYLIAMKRVALACCLLGGILGAVGSAHGQVEQASPWTQRETRLANEYLALLVTQPEEGRVLDLLWQLYSSHGETELLIANITAQATARPHPFVTLVRAHLLKKKGDLAAAAALYAEVLKTEPGNRYALRSAARTAAELAKRAEAIGHYEALAGVLAQGSADRLAAWMEAGDLALSGGEVERAAFFWEKAAGEQADSLEVARQVAQRLLQAGLSSRAAVFFKALAEKADPREKLKALGDLARIQAHADQFEEADTALRTGLGMLHFRDGRFAEFFRQRVRLHERFGRLDELRAELEKAADQPAPAAREAALHGLVAFHTLTVNADERLKALRRLVEAAPTEESYRWDWVRAILDHGEVDEAKVWLDARLAESGGAAPVGWVLLRSEADLRAGDPEAAAARLKALLDAAGGAVAVEKEVLLFAQQRTLDAVVERVLRDRVKREPGRTEAVFELASHLRARQQNAEAQKVLDAYVAASGKADVERVRLGEATSFLMGGSDVKAALEKARRAVGMPGVDREDWLRLADLLMESGAEEEAREALEKAWAVAPSDEQRVEADERLLTLLMGAAREVSAAPTPGAGAEFRLPSVLTGAQFGQEDPPEKQGPTPEMKAQLAKVLEAARADKATAAEKFRAGWWALRCADLDISYAMLRALALDPATGRPVELSLEAENLALELAMEDQNRVLALRVLGRLKQRDPGNQTRYLLREVEIMLEAEQQRREQSGRQVWRSDEAKEIVGQDAVRVLEEALRREPVNELLLSALSRILLLQRQPEVALKRWQEAAERMSGTAAIPLLERQAELMLATQDLPGHIETGLKVVALETDVGRRREAFKRFLDRLTAADANGRELETSVLKDRLTMVVKALESAAARRPFDAFYPEALAQTHLRAEDPVAAFAAMKRAYYTAPDTPFSLDQLRDAALRVEDMALAVYFQKQVAAAAGPAEVSKETRFLVELLERDFQMDQADQVRRRLERRFSQDVKALQGLAAHYQETGQDEAQRRVLEQIARVRPWDGRVRLELALQCLKVGDKPAAKVELERLLEALPAKKETAVTSLTQVALPLTDLRQEGKRGTAGQVADLLESVTGIEAAELEPLRVFLKMPRPEFARLPETPERQRLRAVEELARLQETAAARQAWRQRWQARSAESPTEALWALFYATNDSDPTAFSAAVATVLKGFVGVEADFARAWLLLRGHAMSAALTWAADQEGVAKPALGRRTRLLQAGLLALVDLPGHVWSEAEMLVLSRAQLLPTTALLELTRKLQDRQHYEPALALGEWLRQHSRTLGADYALMMARMAESAERWDLARHYLDLAVGSPTTPGRYQGVYDPFLYSVGALARTARSRQERDAALEKAWKHLQKTPSSDMTELRRAAVAGLAGAETQAVDRLERWVRDDFLGNRPLGQKPGGLMPQGSLRFEEAPQAQSLWEETREIGALLTQQGLAGVSAAAEQRLLEKWGSVQLGPRPGYEFNELRIAHLLRSLRGTDHASRLRLIRNWLAPVDMKVESSVELLGELGGKLEAASFAREAIEVFRLLPERAPTNSEYASWLLRASEGAREVEPGKSFSIQLINAVPPYKPPTPGDDALREMHARFLAMDFDLEELRARAFRDNKIPTLPGRLPPETAYLRELARLLERMGLNEEELKAWQRFHACFLHHDDDGLEPDTECVLRQARLLVAANRRTEALAILRARKTAAKPGLLEHEALLLEAELVAAEGQWEALRPLMLRAVEQHEAGTVISLAKQLREKGRAEESLNLLTQAERRAKEGDQRFQLRLELIMVLQADGKTELSAVHARLATLFRTSGREAGVEKRLLDWLAECAMQSEAAEAAQWVAFLKAQARSSPDRVLAAAALSAWAAHWAAGDKVFRQVQQTWQDTAHTEADRRCLELTAGMLLAGGHAQEAWDTAVLAGSLPTLRRAGRYLPVMVKAGAALGRDAALTELFGEVVHRPVPGGERVADWAAAFEETGHADLARELWEAALKAARDTETLTPALASGWARFLIRQKAFPAAESFLLAHDYLLTRELPELLQELFTGWQRLADLPAQVARYRLARGLQQEVLWRIGALKP